MRGDFTVAHPEIVHTHAPAVLGVVWGIAATWWMGAGLGVMLGLAATKGPAAPTPDRVLMRRLCLLLACMAMAAAVAGMAGYELAAGGRIHPPGDYEWLIPKARHARFMAAAFAHLASYAVGGLGGLVVILRTWGERGWPFLLRLAPAGAREWLRLLLIVATLVAVLRWRR